MPMKMMERSPQDIAGGYLLLMLAQGDGKHNATPTKSNTTNSQYNQNHITKYPNSNWNHCDSATINKHPQLGLYVAKNTALVQDSILSLTTRHQRHSNYWNSHLAEMDKQGRYTPFTTTTAAVSHHSPYKVAQDKSFESKLKAPVIPLNYYHHGLSSSTKNKKLEEGEGTLQLQRPMEVKKQLVPSPLVTSSSPSEGSPLPDSLPTPTSDKIPLPQWFTNSTTTVVIGKGHLPRKTPGNFLLRQLVRDHLQDYHESNRRGRATIVSTIYQTIRSMNPDGKNFGNFSLQGEWEEAKEHAARDKIAATFRDCLCDFYKSSTKSKVAKRRSRKAAAETNPPTIASTSRQQQQHQHQ